MAQVLVTGANGHIGSHVVRHLLEQGHVVKPLVRRSSDLRGLEGLDLELCYGDILDPQSLELAARGCELVFHLAAPYVIRGVNEDEVIRPAVEGTRNVLAAAARAGARRMVHTSSVAAIGYTRSKDHPFGEHDWFETGPRLPYNRAKVESERLLNQLAKDYTTETVVVCPAMVLGALDYRVTPSNHYIQDLLNRDGITGRGGFNLVDVDDVARGHLLAADKGRAGGRYILGGEHVEGRRLGRLIGEITGKAPIHISAPRWMSLAVAGLIEGGARLLGNEPPVTLMEARIHADRFSVYDESASRQELGYVAQPARITLERTASWLAHIGALNESVAKTVLERFPPDPSWFGEPRDDRRARKRREPLASAGHRTKTSPH